MKILIADDHAVVREGLRALLQTRKGWHVCAEVQNGREAVAQALRWHPDVVVLDFSMPELNGLEAVRRIRQALPETEVLVLTMHDSEELARQVLAAGARGYMLKSDPGKELLAAVEAMGRHQPYLTPQIGAMVLQGFVNGGRPQPKHQGAVKPMTSRELEIVQLLAEGNSGKEIAARLHLSTKTIEAHRGNIMRKLNVHSTVDLLRYAIRNNIVEA